MTTGYNNSRKKGNFLQRVETQNTRKHESSSALNMLSREHGRSNQKMNEKANSFFYSSNKQQNGPQDVRPEEVSFAQNTELESGSNLNTQSRLPTEQTQAISSDQ